MRAVLRTTNRALIESARLALETEGIGVVVDQELGNVPFIPMAVLVSEADFDRASEVVRDLGPPPLNVVKDDDPAPRIWRGVFIAIVILIILLSRLIFIR